MVEKPESFGEHGSNGFESIIADVKRNNSDIQRQNLAYENLIESDGITNDKLWCRVVDFLSTSQQDSIEALSSEAVSNFYELVIKEEARLRSEIGKISLLLEEASSCLTPIAEDIKKQEELVVQYLPEISDSVHEIAEKIIGEIAIEKTTQIEQEMLDIQREYEDFITIYENAGEAWPIPRVVALQNHNSDVEVDKDPELVMDIFPDTKKPATLTTRQIAEKIRRRYPEEILKDASAFVALFLAEEPGRIYSYKDLAEALYGEADRKSTRKVNALISGFQLGKVKIIGDHLRQEGLVLQKGRRYKYDPGTQQAFGVRSSVLRAIEPKLSSSDEIIIHNIDKDTFVYDSWETVCLDRAVDDEQIIPNTERKPFDTNSTEELHSKTVVENKTDDIENISTDNVIDLREDTLKDKKKRQIPLWEIELENDITEVINLFEEQGLMDKKLPLSRGVFRRKTRSKMHGTKTMIERALANGIINTQQTDINEPLEIYQYICMSLQNDHPEVFSDKRRRKVAVKKVQKLVDEYFARKNTSN